MGALRTMIRSRRWLALWLIAVALAVKAFVPQGYMIAPGKTLTVTLCSAADGATMAMTLPMKANPGEGHSNKPQDGGCAYASLGHAALGGADPVLLLVLAAFLLALG